MDPLKIIKKYYRPGSKAYQILVSHSALVARKALAIAKRVPELNPDVVFIKEAAMLHDIGIFLTHAPLIDCHGSQPYLSHGVLGSALLKKEGFMRHALVCERHTGVGITKKEIILKKLPLPRHDLVPQTVEEQIIAFADKFYSKDAHGKVREESTAEIKKELLQFGKEKVKKFEMWCLLFKEQNKEIA